MREIWMRRTFDGESKWSHRGLPGSLLAAPGTVAMHLRNEV